MPRTDAFATDDAAARYDAWFDAHPAAFAAEVAALRHLFPPLPPGARTVEVGVGTGRFAAALGVREGVEPAAAMARRARLRGIAVTPGVAERLPLADASCHLVLMVTVLCFVDDPEAALAEAHRVLVPGGHLLLGFIDAASPLGRRYARERRPGSFYAGATFRTARQVARLLRRAGFADLAWAQTVFGSPEEMETPDPVRPGHGRGGFVAVRARKPLPVVR